MHDSLAEMAHGIYEVLTFGKHYYRPIGEDPVKTATATTNVINETVDESVFRRWRADSGYRPKNLKGWADRKNADITALTSSVTARDPTVVAPD